jgi:hypothetical protein
MAVKPNQLTPIPKGIKITKCPTRYAGSCMWDMTPTYAHIGANAGCGVHNTNKDISLHIESTYLR